MNIFKKYLFFNKFSVCNFFNIFAPDFSADVAELVDALDLGSSAARRGGSSPFIRTILSCQKLPL